MASARGTWSGNLSLASLSNRRTTSRWPLKQAMISAVDPVWTVYELSFQVLMDALRLPMQRYKAMPAADCLEGRLNWYGRGLYVLV